MPVSRAVPKKGAGVAEVFAASDFGGDLMGGLSLGAIRTNALVKRMRTQKGARERAQRDLLAALARDPRDRSDVDGYKIVPVTYWFKALEGLTDAQRLKVAKMATLRKAKAGEIICRQGAPATAAWGVVVGSATVVLLADDEDPESDVLLGKHHPKGTFLGEEALRPNDGRLRAVPSSVRASDPEGASLVEFPALQVRRLLWPEEFRDAEGSSDDEAEIDGRTSVELFTGLPDEVREDIKFAMELRQYPAGHILARRGDASKLLYIIRDGEARAGIELGADTMPAELTAPRDAWVDLAVMGRGEAFGLVQALRGKPWPCTIVCSSAVAVYTLRGPDLRALVPASLVTSMLQVDEDRAAFRQKRLRDVVRQLRGAAKSATDLRRRLTGQDLADDLLGGDESGGGGDDDDDDTPELDASAPAEAAPVAEERRPARRGALFAKSRRTSGAAAEFANAPPGSPTLQPRATLANLHAQQQPQQSRRQSSMPASRAAAAGSRHRATNAEQLRFSVPHLLLYQPGGGSAPIDDRHRRRPPSISVLAREAAEGRPPAGPQPGPNFGGAARLAISVGEAQPLSGAFGAHGPLVGAFGAHGRGVGRKAGADASGGATHPRRPVAASPATEAHVAPDTHQSSWKRPRMFLPYAHRAPAASASPPPEVGGFAQAVVPPTASNPHVRTDVVPMLSSVPTSAFAVLGGRRPATAPAAAAGGGDAAGAGEHRSASQVLAQLDQRRPRSSAASRASLASRGSTRSAPAQRVPLAEENKQLMSNAEELTRMLLPDSGGGDASRSGAPGGARGRGRGGGSGPANPALQRSNALLARGTSSHVSVFTSRAGLPRFPNRQRVHKGGKRR